jgi:hypothetical protein
LAKELHENSPLLRPHWISHALSLTVYVNTISIPHWNKSMPFSSLVVYLSIYLSIYLSLSWTLSFDLSLGLSLSLSLSLALSLVRALSPFLLNSYLFGVFSLELSLGLSLSLSRGLFLSWIFSHISFHFCLSVCHSPPLSSSPSS